MLLFLIKSWRIVGIALAALAVWGIVVHLRNTIDNLREEVSVARTNEALARTAAQTERANADRLEYLLQRAQSDALAERNARDAAEKERDNALQAAARRSAERDRTIIVERDRDPTLDMCLSYELPDSIVRQLPFDFAPAGAGSDTGGSADPDLPAG